MQVYQLLSFDDAHKPPPPLASYNTPTSRLYSLGSCSKILAPAARVGWIQAPARLLHPVLSSGQVQSGGGLAPLTSALVHQCIMDGMLSKHVQRLRASLRERCHTLCTALRTGLPPGVSMTAPLGGYFVWLTWQCEDVSALHLCSTAMSTPAECVTKPYGARMNHACIIGTQKSIGDTLVVQ